MSTSGGRARCQGCGKEGSSRAVARHIRGCVDYAGLYQNDSAALLDPGEVYRLAHLSSNGSRKGNARTSEAVEVVSLSASAGSVQVETWDWPSRLGDDGRS